MMTLIDRLRADALAARKAGSVHAGLYSTLIGEIETKTKTFSPARDMTEEEVVAVVKKFIKNVDETIAAIAGVRNLSAEAKAMAEKGLLETYLPRQMTEPEIEEFARGILAKDANLGTVMAALKANFAGRYDGKMASTIVRNLLASS